MLDVENEVMRLRRLWVIFGGDPKNIIPRVDDITLPNSEDADIARA